MSTVMEPAIDALSHPDVSLAEGESRSVVAFLGP